MHWVRIAVSIMRNSDTTTLSGALGVSVPTTTGHLVGVYAGMAEEKSSGDLSAVSDVALEQWAMWTGKRGRFASAFRAQLCTAQGVVRSWEKYNGAAIRESDTDRARKTAARVAKKAGRPSGGLPADGPADRPAIGTRDVTLRYDTVPQTTHKADDAVVRAAYDSIAPAIGANGRDALRSLLAAVPDPESWARIIRGYASGQSMAQGRPAGAERLAAALEDFVAQGHHRTNPRPNLFRGFVTSAKSLPAPKERQMTIETDKADELLCLREQNVRRALVNEPPRPLPRWADEIDRMFPDGRTWPRGAAA